MLSSGLVVRNQGFGTIPSTYQQHEDYLIRPSVPLQPAPMANQAQRAPKRTATEMLFPKLQYEYLFPKFSYDLNRSRTIVGDNAPFIGPMDRDRRFPNIYSDDGAPPTSYQPADSQAATSQPTATSKVATTAAKAVAATGTALAGYLMAPTPAKMPIKILMKASLPRELGNFAIQTDRILEDFMKKNARMFEDAVLFPATQVGAEAAMNGIYGALFGPGGALGDGWFKTLADSVRGNYQGINFNRVLQIAGTGAQQAASTMAGQDVELNTQNLIQLFASLAAYQVLPALAPQIAAFIGSQLTGADPETIATWVRGMNLRDVQRITYPQ